MATSTSSETTSVAAASFSIRLGTFEPATKTPGTFRIGCTARSGARKLAFQRQFTLLDGVAPAIEPPMDIPERLTRRRRELAKPSRRRPR
ncbi:MAG: hypothetical protein AAGA56_29585, partial [Myxococcota bacterium]